MDIQYEQSHHHRGLSDIRAMLTSSRLKPRVIELAMAIFQTLAEAEAKVHGSTIEEVHFHEVGALDSIIDIVGAAIGLDYFQIEQLFASTLPSSSGQVKTEHGLIPLPAPATLEIMRKSRMTLIPTSSTKELVTPTGAAILGAHARFSQPAMRLETIGIGAGKRDLPWPNILRLMIGEGEGENNREEPGMVVLETNIDDMNPQLYAAVQASLFTAGALDVYHTPIYMKKNRPATMLSVICHKKDEPALGNILLRQTTTFGVRVHPIWRYEAKRKMVELSTPFGIIPAKVKVLEGKAVLAMPEYDACLKQAEEAGVPVMDVYQAALAACQAYVHG
jgi:hypothetical protein